MRIVVIGTGYVGLVSGTCFAEIGHRVTCIDIDPKKVEMLKAGKSPIYEPGLSDLLERNIEQGRLDFTTDYSVVAEAKAVFLAVQTPSGDDGRADLKYLLKATEQVGEFLDSGAFVVIKSTVPVGTHQEVEKVLEKSCKNSFEVVNNPEFLKEGSAIDDFMKPDRIVIGHRTPAGGEAMEELYRPLMLQGNPIYKMSNLSAEMTKYAANCFLATKISFINEIAKLCDQTGADINQVRKGITSDERIGTHFLYPGPGYGGSCFPKDVKALIATAEDVGGELRIIQAAEDVNARQKLYMADKILGHLGNDLTGKKIAFWGVAFKPNTDDVRETPAFYMAQKLIEHGARIVFYDPVASQNFLKMTESNPVLKDNISMASNNYDCLQEADALVLMTEWREFRAPDFNKVKEALKGDTVFDARNLYRTADVQNAGLSYFAIGKKID